MRYVLRQGVLVEADRVSANNPPPARSALCAPMVSRMESYESPVTGASISSWRQRDRDMKAANAVDPRDIPASAREKRRARSFDRLRTDEPDAPFEWRKPAKNNS